MQHIVVGFNPHNIHIPIQFDEDFSANEDFKHVVNYRSYNDEEFSSDKHLVNDGYFPSAIEDTGRQNPSPDFNAIGQYSNKDIKLLARCKYYNKYYRRLH